MLKILKKGKYYYPRPSFPIGSIYLTVEDINPADEFGGTWEKIAQGRTLVGVDPDDTDFNKPEKTGGSKYMQKHQHNGIYFWGDKSRYLTPNPGDNKNAGNYKDSCYLVVEVLG